MSDKLPKELERIRRKSHNLQKVASEPAMGHAELEELEEKVRTNSNISNILLINT